MEININQINELVKIASSNGNKVKSIELTSVKITMSSDNETASGELVSQNIGEVVNQTITETNIIAIPNCQALKTITSPMVGVFYRAPSPDSKPFVEVGDKVKKGDVLCIVEAMKLMNEIEAEYDCEIVEICVPNGEAVEFSQVLFKVTC